MEPAELDFLMVLLNVDPCSNMIDLKLSQSVMSFAALSG